MGRGGSDTTAVALGVALGAESVQFFKDVRGIFDRDPNIDCKANFLNLLSYSQALDIAKKGAKVLHPRCIDLASKNGLKLHVRSFQSQSLEGTLIEDEGLIPPVIPIYETDA